jgi:hypothetical protein
MLHETTPRKGCVNELPVTRHVADNPWGLWTQRQWSARRLTEKCARADAVGPAGEMIFKIESGPGKLLTDGTRPGVGRIRQVSAANWPIQWLP